VTRAQVAPFVIRRWNPLVGVDALDEEVHAETVVHVPTSVALRVEAQLGHVLASQFLEHIAGVVVALSCGEASSNQPPSIDGNAGLALRVATTDNGYRLTALHPDLHGDPTTAGELTEPMWPRCSLSGLPIVQVGRSGHLGAARAIDIMGNPVTVAAMTGHGVYGWPWSLVVRNGEAFAAELRWATAGPSASFGTHVEIVKLPPPDTAVEGLRQRPEWTILGDLPPWKDLPPPATPPRPQERQRKSEWLGALAPIGSGACRLTLEGDAWVVHHGDRRSISFDDIYDALEHLGGAVHHYDYDGFGAELYVIGGEYLVHSSGPDGSADCWHDLGAMDLPDAIALTEQILDEAAS
jgi:hypothetical protein